MITHFAPIGMESGYFTYFQIVAFSSVGNFNDNNVLEVGRTRGIKFAV